MHRLDTGIAGTALRGPRRDSRRQKYNARAENRRQSRAGTMLLGHCSKRMLCQGSVQIASEGNQTVGIICTSLRAIATAFWRDLI